MLWRKGNLPPPLLDMKIGESQYGGQCGGSLSNENENESPAYKAKLIHLALSEACILHGLNQYFLLFNSTRERLLVLFNKL